MARLGRATAALLVLTALLGGGARAQPLAGGGFIITTIAGGMSGALVATATAVGAVGVAVDRAGNVYIADAFNHRVWLLNATTGLLTTVAGNGLEGFSGDGGPATSAHLIGPRGVAVDGGGNLYIIDNHMFPHVHGRC